MFLLRRSFRRRLLIVVLSALACVARAAEVASPQPTANPRYLISAQGVEGTVNSLVRHHGELIAGGSEGVARGGADGLFRVWPGLPGPVRGLVSRDGWLFSAGAQLRGAQPVPGEVRVLEKVDSYAVLPLVSAPGWYAYGCGEGLRWAHFVGEKWVSEGPLKTITGVLTDLFEAPAGVVGAWCESDGSAWRIDFRGGLSVNAPARNFGVDDGLPAGNGSIAMRQLGGEPVALANGRLRRLDEATARFAPETRVAGVEGFPIERVHVSSDGTCGCKVARQRTKSAGSCRKPPGKPLTHPGCRAGARRSCPVSRSGTCCPVHSFTIRPRKRSGSPVSAPSLPTIFPGARPARPHRPSLCCGGSKPRPASYWSLSALSPSSSPSLTRTLTKQKD